MSDYLADVIAYLIVTFAALLSFLGLVALSTVIVVLTLKGLGVL